MQYFKRRFKLRTEPAELKMIWSIALFLHENRASCMKKYATEVPEICR